MRRVARQVSTRSIRTIRSIRTTRTTGIRTTAGATATAYYGYNPFWYGGYAGYSYYGSGGYADTGVAAANRTRLEIAMGSIRLRASPSNAKVYVDGTLMGIVDDFDGLSNHLDLSAGQHTLELRADGYETYSGTINVLLGKTMTERVTLKKK